MVFGNDFFRIHVRSYVIIVEIRVKVYNFVGRKPKNQYLEAEIADCPNSVFRLFEVEFPFTVQVEYEVKIGGNENNPHWATTSEIIYLPISEKDQIIEQCQKHGFKVVNIKPWTVKIPDICPNCNNKGVPKIEIKNTTDQRTRNWKYKEKPSESLPKRPNEYWLVFFHSPSRKKCRIQQCISTPHPAFKKNLRKQIEIEKYFFPRCLQWMKRYNFN